MRKIFLIIMSVFIAAVCLVGAASAVNYDPEAVPKCTPMITAAVLNDDGSVSVTLFVENRHVCSAEQFCLSKALISFGTRAVDVSNCIKNKTIKPGVKPYTVKLASRKLPDITDDELALCSYELAYTYVIGERNYTGAVKVDGAEEVTEDAEAENEAEKE